MRTIKKAIDIKKIDLQTEENCFYAVLKSGGEYIKYVLSPSDNLIKFALRINGNNIRFIPDEKKTEEVCMLAAIHGASINLLPIHSENVTKTCELIAYMIEANEVKSSRGWRSSINNVYINGELTNFANRFSPNLFEDIDEYNQYYVNWGYNLNTNRLGRIYIKDGKIITFNNALKDYSKAQKYEFQPGDVSSLFYNGVFDPVLAKNTISKQPAIIMDLDDEYITPTLIAEAIYKDLDVANYDRLAQIDLKTVTKAGTYHATSDNWYSRNTIPRDEIMQKLFHLNGKITDEMITIMVDKGMSNITLPYACMSGVEPFKDLVKRFNDINKKRHASYYSGYHQSYEMLLSLFKGFKTGASFEDLVKIVSFYPITLSACSNQKEVFEELGIEIMYKFFDDLKGNVLHSYDQERILENNMNFEQYDVPVRKLMYKYAKENNINVVVKYFEKYNLQKG